MIVEVSLEQSNVNIVYLYYLYILDKSTEHTSNVVFMLDNEIVLWCRGEERAWGFFLYHVYILVCVFVFIFISISRYKNYLSLSISLTLY